VLAAWRVHARTHARDVATQRCVAAVLTRSREEGLLSEEVRAAIAQEIAVELDGGPL
jgi:hypothetical protein